MGPRGNRYQAVQPKSFVWRAPFWGAGELESSLAGGRRGLASAVFFFFLQFGYRPRAAPWSRYHSPAQNSHPTTGSRVSSLFQAQFLLPYPTWGGLAGSPLTLQGIRSFLWLPWQCFPRPTPHPTSFARQSLACTYMYAPFCTRAKRD